MARRIGDQEAYAYQERMAGEVAGAMAEGRSGAVLAPTGSGKTNLIAMAAADARAAGRPVLILSPNTDLMEQLVGKLASMPEFAGAQVNAFVAKDERMEVAVRGGLRIVRDRLDSGVAPEADEVAVATRAGLAEASADPRFAGYAEGFGRAGGVVLDAGTADGAAARPLPRGGLTLATNGSLRNKDEAALAEQIRAFGEAGGVVLVDEGQTVGAKEIGKVMERLARAGASCIQFSATPWREDGTDTLEAFGSSVGDGLIAAATYEEVRATGRIVGTRFECANDWLRQRLAPGVSERIDAAFDDIVAGGRSAQQASEEAFGQFFRDDADEGDRAIGAGLVQAFADRWEAEAVGRRAAILHCDRVDTASALTREIAGRGMPYGHPRHGAKATTCLVTGKEVVLVEGGRRVDLAAERGWRTYRQQRRGVIALARDGAIDAMVNVNALGTGTDVPVLDLNMLVSYRRNLSFLRQTEGRAGRASPGKTDQAFIDMGTSLQTHWPNLKAFAEGREDLVDPKLMRIDRRILAEMHAWMASDPRLDAQVDVELRARNRARRGRDEPREEAAAAFDGWRETARTPAPTPIDVGNGISTASTFTRMADVGPEGRDFVSRSAYFVDGAVVVLEMPRGSAQSLATDDPGRARDFAAFCGVTPRRPNHGAVTPETRAQLAALDETERQRARRRGVPPQEWPTPADAGTAAAQREARYNLQRAETEIARALGRRLFPGSPELVHPLASVVLERPEDMGQARVEAMERYLALAGRNGIAVRVLATDAAGARHAQALFGGVARSVGTLTAGDEALARQLACGRAAGWRAKGREGTAWIRDAAGLDRRGASEEAQDARFAAILRTARFVDSRHAVGRFADLAPDPDLARRLASGGPFRVGEEAVSRVATLLAGALASVPAATAKGWGREDVTRGRAALAEFREAPDGRRLVLDQDRARTVFAGLGAGERRELLAAMRQTVARQPQPKGRREAARRDPHAAAPRTEAATRAGTAAPATTTMAARRREGRGL